MAKLSTLVLPTLAVKAPHPHTGAPHQVFVLAANPLRGIALQGTLFRREGYRVEWMPCRVIGHTATGAQRWEIEDVWYVRPQSAVAHALGDIMAGMRP